MSIKDRLAKKTADLMVGANQAPTKTPSDNTANSSAVREARGPLTAPGQMLAFRKQMQESDTRIHELEDRLNEFKGGALVQRIDAKLIRPSKWANRHNYSYSDANFLAFRAEIESAGGNVQPILVRKLVGAETGYEVVFGHRRHRACLDLDMPVLAFVGDLSDKELFSMMERENRLRADLSPFEQGEMYRRALDEGLFPSLRKLSAELGVDASLVSKAVTIARLPVDVLACFDSPTLIQYRWGKELTEAIQKDPEGILSRGRQIRAATRKKTPRQIVDALIARPEVGQGSNSDIKRNGVTVAELVTKKNGSIEIRFVAGVIKPNDVATLRDKIEKLLSTLET